MTERKVQITVVQGNIVKQSDCDAIVNSANENLRAGSGVCGAIYRASGPELEPCSIQFAPLALGQVVATPAFNLPNKFIIHTRGPKYFFDEEPAENLAAAMRNTILLAEKHKIARIAVPAISMGIFKYPAAEAIPILVKSARATASQLEHLREVRFVVLEEALFMLFSNEIQRNK
jgi:O-acetyl-ADP-ribose deacetylase (regulator of RNase III)